MKAFGFTRTHARCRVYRAGFGKKIAFSIHVKNHKRGRRTESHQEFGS